MPEKASKFISLIIWSLALRSINHKFTMRNAIDLLAEKEKKVYLLYFY